MVAAVPVSTISKHSPDISLAIALGREIRRRRLLRGLTQTELGRPFTRAFVSAVETGRCLPSLSTLLLMAHRLGVTAGDLLHEVNPGLAQEYTPIHGSHQPPDGHDLCTRQGP